MILHCSRCDWEYPEHLLSPLIGSIQPGPVCAICAREIKKSVHGVDIPFRAGTQAAKMEEEAIAWRKNRPGCAPSSRP